MCCAAYFSSFAQHGNGIMMLMAGVRNVKCVHGAQNVRQRHFFRGKEDTKKAI